MSKLLFGQQVKGIHHFVELFLIKVNNFIMIKQLLKRKNPISMNPILQFALLIIVVIIPFGLGIVWFLYRKSIIFYTSITIFMTSMIMTIMAFIVGRLGFVHLWWGVPASLVLLLSVNGIAKILIKKPALELS